MKPAKLQAAFVSFHGHFLKPLLAGGPVETARPLAPGVLAHFAVARPDDGDEEHAVLEAIYAVASEIAPVHKLEWPTFGAMALAVACDDLAVMTDEALSMRARRVIATWVEELLELAAVPDTRSDALARHAVVSRFAALRREDVTVKNWAYTYRFFGRDVPKRVTAWPWLRRVKIEAQTRLFGDLVARAPSTLGVAQLWREVVSRSPVTELVDRRLAPSFVFSQASARVLADPVLRSGIARRIAQDGRSHDQVEALGAALLALQDATPTVLYCVLALLYEVHVTILLGGDVKPWSSSTQSAMAFDAVLSAVSRSALPFGPTLLAGPDRARIAAAARAVRVPRELDARLDAMVEAALGHAPEAA